MQDKSDSFKIVLINTSLNMCEEEIKFIKQQYDVVQ